MGAIAEHGPLRPGKLVLVFFCMVVVAYVAIFGVLDRANLLHAVPTYEDDYRTLAYNFPDLPLLPIRPLAFYTSFLMGSFGPLFSFTGAQVLALVNMALYFTFTTYYLRIKRILPAAAVCAVVCALSLEHLVEYSRYLAVLFNLYASTLAAMSLLFLTHSFRVPIKKARLPLSAGIAMALLSLLCKEEFCAPIILFCLLCSVPKVGERNRALALGTAAILLVTSLSVLAYEKFVFNSPFLGNASIYSVNWSLQSILSSYWRYFTDSMGTRLACVAQMVSLAFALVLPLKESFFRLLALLAITLLIMAPFSILPHHFLTFYTFDWTALQCSTLLAFSKIEELGEIKGLRLGASKWLKPSLSVLLLVPIPFMIVATDPLRLAKFAWHGERGQFNSKVVSWLREHRVLLNRYERIAVTGLPLGSPWYGNDGAYLRNKLGLTSSWLVLTPSNSDLYRAQNTCSSLKYGSIEVEAWDSDRYASNLPGLAVHSNGSIDFMPVVSPERGGRSNTVAGTDADRLDASPRGH